jgi:ABC-type transporter Mla subunit MlaD
MEPDDREFMRQLLRRHEKATDAMIARFNEMTARFNAMTARFEENTRRFAAHTDRFVAHTEEMRRDHSEFWDEQRAQRQALLRMLDRLDGGPEGAGA